MNVDPDHPQDPDRDRFVLSKGHCTPALYPVLSLRGFFPQEDLKLFRSIKGHYSGHAEMRHVRGVDMSTGSLGQGVSAAAGMALAAKYHVEMPIVNMVDAIVSGHVPVRDAVDKLMGRRKTTEFSHS